MSALSPNVGMLEQAIERADVAAATLRATLDAMRQRDMLLAVLTEYLAALDALDNEVSDDPHGDASVATCQWFDRADKAARTAVAVCQGVEPDLMPFSLGGGLFDGGKQCGKVCSGMPCSMPAGVICPDCGPAHHDFDLGS